jgi:hypothetical protein
MLLVLIDNIENLRCRRDLISRLHNHNVASIKTFEHITGIKLDKTHKKRIAQLELIQKSDYTAKPKHYKPRKSKEQADYNDIFYKKRLNEDGISIDFVEARGRLWNYDGYDFFITYAKKGDKISYTVTEGKTGILVTSGNTLKEVQAAAKEITNNMRGGKPLETPFAAILERNIKNHGISPLYKEKE